MKDLYDLDRDGFTKILEETTDVEWVEYEDFDGSKKAYPFWKSVIASKTDTYKDFLEWFKKQRAYKEKSLVNIVTPKADFDSDSTNKATVLNSYKEKIATKLKDMTGVVKPKSEVKVNKVEQVKPTKETKGKSTLNDNVGIVKSKSEVKVNKPEEVKETKETKGKSTLNNNVGEVEVKKADFGKKAKPEIDNDFSTPNEATILSDWSETLMDKFKKINLKD